MKHIIITQPEHVYDADPKLVMRHVAEFNARILAGKEHPTNTEFVSPRSMLGDPNNVFSEDVEELLVAHEILNKHLWRNHRGVVVKLDTQEVFTYTWGAGEFAALEESELLRVGWDLRRVPGFCNVVLVDDEVLVSETEVEVEAPVEAAPCVALSILDRSILDEPEDYSLIVEEVPIDAIDNL